MSVPWTTVPTTDAVTPRVQSVDRALTILDVLADRGEAGVTEIALELDVHKSTAFRLLAVLEARGMVEQDGDRGKYRLGFAIVRLAGATTARLDLARQSRQTCEELASAVGETVNMAILDGDAVVSVSQVRGTAAITSENAVGKRSPVHATAVGKAILAFSPAHVREAVLAGPLRPLTAATHTNPAELAADLDRVRARGWAGAVEEYEVGLNAVAAPVLASEGTVVAAVCVGGPSFRLTAERLGEVAEPVMAAAVRISRRLGLSG